MLEGGSPIFKQSQHKSFYSFPTYAIKTFGLAPSSGKVFKLFCFIEHYST